MTKTIDEMNEEIYEQLADELILMLAVEYHVDVSDDEWTSIHDDIQKWLRNNLGNLRML
jgi:hypothetical protein